MQHSCRLCSFAWLLSGLVVVTQACQLTTEIKPKY